MSEPTPTKRCPGFAAAGIPPHEAPATSEFFAADRNLPMGLGLRCREHDKLYQRAWRERKAAKTSGEQPATPAATAPPAPPSELTVSGVVPPTRYHDDLARQVARAKGKGQYHGWVTEEIDGTVYAVPSGNGAVGSPEGQAALEAVHEATEALRRKRDADRKRRERAAKKEAAAAAQA